jgi:hypothetical protein
VNQDLAPCSVLIDPKTIFGKGLQHVGEYAGSIRGWGLREQGFRKLQHNRPNPGRLTKPTPNWCPGSLLVRRYRASTVAITYARLSLTGGDSTYSARAKKPHRDCEHGATQWGSVAHFFPCAAAQRYDAQRYRDWLENSCA